MIASAQGVSIEMDNPDIQKNGDLISLGPIKDRHSSQEQSSFIHESTEKNQQRGNWGRQLDFFLTCVGYAVGLANIWRFPYLCMRNGGGAFLIPYLTFLVIAGIPLVFMELALGQFSGCSPLPLWKICPLFKGLGWGMLSVSFMFTVYCNAIISWTLYYLAMSFQYQLPWANCDNEWNTERCVERVGKNETVSFTNTTTDVLVVNTVSTTEQFLENGTSYFTLNLTKIMTPAEEFWQYNTLEMSEGIDKIGGIRWQLALCHLAGWIIVFLCVIKGVKSTGKVVYVTATLPYILLLALLVRGCMMPGSLQGIMFYLVPDFKRLLNLQIWAEACLQIFYSLGPAWGGLITMASYNKFHHNIYRDAILVPIINCGSSLFAGIVVFSVIGAMAYDTGLSVDEVITSGPGLAFVAYPEAISRLPLSPLWAVLFFLMLLTIILDSQFVTFETLVSCFVDEFPNVLRRRKMLVTFTTAFIEMLVGLIFCTRAGIYIFQIVDWYAAVFAVVLIAALECLIVSHLYGMNRLTHDIGMMIGRVPCAGWKVLWGFVTPGLMLSCFLYSIISLDAPVYGDYRYPPWITTVGWIIASVSIVHIPILMIHRLISTDGTFFQRLRSSVKPSASWGPALEKYRKEYKYINTSAEMLGKE